MNRKRHLSRYPGCARSALAAAVSTALLLVAGAPAAAQQTAPEDADIDVIVTIGSRVEGRTVTDTPVPVDVIDSEALERIGYTETARLLQQLAPSFNFGNNTISDGSDIARPATLRGMNPDQILVLVNGKRHVGQSWVNVGDSFGRGATGVDINAIPTSAIERIEILRDGASSQYGSDAIAGVINIVLKSNSEGTLLRSQWGQTYEGDGAVFHFGANGGLPLGNGGYLSLTGEYRDRDFTNRAVQSNRSVAFPGATPTAGDIIFRVGDSEAEDLLFLVNAGLPLANSAELYGFAKYNDRDGLSAGFYRHPHQADRSVPQVFPDGFLPLQTTSVEDSFIVVGVRGSFTNDWGYDFSLNYGRNEFGFGAENTVNASIAAEFLASNPGASDAEIAANAGPGGGFSGGLELEQLIFNADFRGTVDIGTADPFHVATGFEYREEDFAIEEGDLASFSCGLTNTRISFPSVVDPAETANCGFQGFPGYSPDFIESIDRSNFALYVDVEKNVLESWLLTGALRYEDYDDVGDEITGKLATRIDLSDNVSLRGALSTGFRAASLPQKGFSSVVTQAGAGGLSQTLNARNADPFTQALGVGELDFESSTNISAGIVFDLRNVTLSIDAYQIDVDDRLVLSEAINADTLDAVGLTAAADNLRGRNINQGAVYFNGLETETRGVDLIASHLASVATGQLTTSLAVAWNETEIDEKHAPGGIDPDVFIGKLSESLIEDVQPNTRATLTFDYATGPFDVLLRGNYYGSTSSTFFTAEQIFGCPPNEACGPVAPFGLDTSDTIEVSSAVLFDLELGWQVNEMLRLIVGGNNIFDETPDALSDNAVIRWISDGGGFGGPPASSFGNFQLPLRGVSYGINGGFYYARAELRL